MKLYFTFILLVVVSLNSWANDHYYCGVIKAKNNLPIILRISSDNQSGAEKNSITAQYFYRKFRKVIPLQTSDKTVTHLTLVEDPKGSKTTLTLSKTDSCSVDDDLLNCMNLSGTMVKNTAQFPITLYTIDNPDDATTLNSYIQGIKPKKVTLGSTTVELVPKKVKNFDFDFRITHYKDASKITELNKFLNPPHETNSESEADDLTSYCDDIFLQQSTEFDLISENILYIDTRVTGMMPEAAYPQSDEGEGKYYDLANQTKLDINTVFIDFEKNKKDIINIVFAKKIRKAVSLAKSSKKDAAGNHIDADNQDQDDDSHCWEQYLPEELYGQTEFEIHLDKTKKLLGLSVNYPHVLNACNFDEQYVALSKIQNYLNKKSEVYRFLTS